MTSEFDPLHYLHELEAAGVSRDQADVHAQALAKVVSALAEADDVSALGANVRQEIIQSEKRLALRMDAFKTELFGRIDITRFELEKAIVAANTRIDVLDSRLHAKIERIEAELQLLRWVIGLQAALSIAVLVKQFAY